MRAAKLAGMIAGAAAAVSVFSFRASAVQLTPSQTLALYGTTLPAVYMDASGNTYDVTFEYRGTTLEWMTTEQITDGHLIAFETDRFYNGTSGINTLNGWRDTAPALIYSASIQPQVSDSNLTAEFELTPSVNLDNISNFAQFVFYSGNVSPDGLDTGTSGGWWNRSWIYNNCPPVGRLQFFGLYNGAFQAQNQWRTYAIWRAFDQNAVLPNVTYAPMYGIYNNVNQSERFTLQDQNFHLNSVRGVQDSLGFWRTYLLIGCPDIDREYAGPTMPPATSTLPVTTTRPDIETAVTYTTAVTIDDFQDDIQEIIRNQRWQIYQQEIMIRNQQVQNNTLRDILDKLDSIYVQMFNQNPELELNNRVKIERALQDYSQPSIPESARDGMTFWGAVAQRLGDLSGITSLGALGLSVGIACWILFRGRQS